MGGVDRRVTVAIDERVGATTSCWLRSAPAIATPTDRCTNGTRRRPGATRGRCSPTALTPTMRWARCSPASSRRSSGAVGPTTRSPPTCSPACATSASASSGAAVARRSIERHRDPVDPRGATVDHAAGVAEAAVVRAAFASLPGEMRDILRLAEVDQLPQQEIATRLAEDPGTVATRAMRARAGPRERLPAPARRHRRPPAPTRHRLPGHPVAHRVVPPGDHRLASASPDRGAPRSVRRVSG